MSCGNYSRKTGALSSEWKPPHSAWASDGCISVTSESGWSANARLGSAWGRSLTHGRCRRRHRRRGSFEVFNSYDIPVVGEKM